MLEIHPWLMVVVLLIFFFLLYQLNDRLYEPLLRFMDERDKTIARDLAEAKQLSSGSEELLRKAQAILDEARSEAAQIRQSAVEKVKEENAAAFSAKQRELDEQYQRFQEELSAKRESLKAVILSQMPLIKESLKAKFSKL